MRRDRGETKRELQRRARERAHAFAEAGQALAAYDPLRALQHVALGDQPEALALRGVALAQLGEYVGAKRLLARAARTFARDSTAARAEARCLAALGEVALAHRDLALAGEALDAAAKSLAALGDRANGLFVEVQRARRLLLLGQLEAAGRLLAATALRGAPARVVALARLVEVEIATRRLHAEEAFLALASAERAARASGLPLLLFEVARARSELEAPVARLVVDGRERPVRIAEVAALFATRTPVIDACQRALRIGDVSVPLVSRPVLLALALALGRAGPQGATREVLASAAFGARRVDDSMRARLRVELGRLRRTLGALGSIVATANGYVLHARGGLSVALLLPPEEGEGSALLALLRGGESWSASALATALGRSQRTIQRALQALRAEARVESIGRGRTQRWVARPSEGGFATHLLLVSRTSPE